MRLTDEQKAEAEQLLLTHQEMSVAVATHIPAAKYAAHKQAIQADRDPGMPTDAEMKVAKSLGMTTEQLVAEQARVAAEATLTKDELRIAKATHIPTVVYARHKAELAAERAAWAEKMQGLDDYAREHLPAENGDQH